MKKMESSSVFLEKNKKLFQCPVCQNDFLKVDGHTFACQLGHQFDVSKKGTLHFFPKSGQNDYGKEMLSSRKSLADTGFFYPILDAIKGKLDGRNIETVLDVGCGEGSHLHYLSEKGLPGVKIGFDISKEAIRLASNHFFDDAFWCVADLAESPFGSHQFDAILNIFSPSHYHEFERLLKPSGVVVKIVPDADYLIELRKKLYGSTYDNDAVITRFKEAYPNHSHDHVRYDVSLTKETYRWMLEMTPLSWGASEETIQKALEEPLPRITVAVSLLVGFS